MPEDPILTAVHEDRDAGYTRLTFDQYVPPAAEYDEFGNFIRFSHDPFKEWDAWAKYEIERVIRQKVPAYPGWKAITEGRHKMVFITLATLMGTDKFYAINLTTHELTPRNIVNACGEILEHYNLPRHRLDMAAFEIARLKHSRLLVRTRPIPS
jgi:hypothetical protein